MKVYYSHHESDQFSIITMEVIPFSIFIIKVTFNIRKMLQKYLIQYYHYKSDPQLQYYHYESDPYLQEAEFQYALEHKPKRWTPQNSNMHMGAIHVTMTHLAVTSWNTQVTSFGPLPEKVDVDDSTNMALSLLQLFKGIQTE